MHSTASPSFSRSAISRPTFIHLSSAGQAGVRWLTSKRGLLDVKTNRLHRILLRSFKALWMLVIARSTLIAHSMGCRVYFRALELGLLDDVFVNLRSESESSTRRAMLSTLTLANPDYGREDFVRRGGGYDLTRQFCKFVTIYANRLDNALIWSEILSRQGIFDPLVYSIGKRVQMLHRDPEDDSSERVNRASRWSLFRGARASVSAELDNEAVEMNEKSQFPGVASIVFNDLPSDSPCHPHDDPDSATSNRDFLDVDVVDTTWMDNNVHAVRHNYFNLNRR
ncbi:hypothetical protein PINS_up008561 [Pythium insidiosum]|nr:hypothetical protein PINS_up008561 [Pythium insidiosum]